MPELPEVETIKRDLLQRLSGAKLLEVEIRNPDFLTKRGLSLSSLQDLVGAKLTEIRRTGKQLALILNDKALIFHLGLTGSLVFKASSEASESEFPLEKHLIVILHFDRGTLLFSDIRKFGNLKILSAEELSDYWSKALGPDALYVSKDDFVSILKRGKGQIKKFLLDQKVLAGLGNIYVDELLFRARIHPERRVESLSSEDLERLYHEMKELLREAISLRGSSIRDYVDGTGTPGLFQTRHQVYGKRGMPCPICGTPLKFLNLHGRGTTFCPVCQK